MKKHLFLALIIAVIFLTKSCCTGPKAVEKTIDYGTLSDSLKAFLPYQDSTKISFLDTNNVEINYFITRKLDTIMLPPPKCKFCCKGIVYREFFEYDEVNFRDEKDTNNYKSFNFSINNHLSNTLKFNTKVAVFEMKLDSLSLYEKIPQITVNSKTYTDVYRIQNKWDIDTSSYMLFNKKNGVIKIKYKSGKSSSLL
jgi:hypothetical protein